MSLVPSDNQIQPELEEELASNPFAYEQPDYKKIPHKHDYQRTVGLAHEFHGKCITDLFKAATKGKGYFLLCSDAELKEYLEAAIKREDWVAVSNYSMMLHSKNMLENEQAKWLAMQQSKETKPNKSCMKLQVYEGAIICKGLQLSGFIFGDVRKKFPDNTFVTTSPIKTVEANIVETCSGSYYELEFLSAEQWSYKITQIS